MLWKPSLLCVFEIFQSDPLQSGRLGISGYDQAELLMLLMLQTRCGEEPCNSVHRRAQTTELTFDLTCTHPARTHNIVLCRQELIKASFKLLLCFELMHRF